LQLSDAEHRLTEMEKPRSDDVLWNLPDYLFSLIDEDHSQSDSHHQVPPRPFISPSITYALFFFIFGHLNRFLLTYYLFFHACQILRTYL